MSDLFSRIAEDEEEYETACLIFGEKVRRNNGPDCYGKHAKQIIDKMNKAGYGNKSRQFVLDGLASGTFPIK
jgi:hypothetical protein